ncbi:hypothetical protein GCM10011322_44310 [Salinarimonas ramus]|uniref:Uncharacterized protein n=1 Tax=Salinarimonas ramus TaxID=690164 RepID=A0A917QJB4_9HYPH|nr:hypothetical protein GCM10011322_44310 [Salinarimonas ramus]
MASRDEIQEALEIVAYAVEVHGEAYAPLLERLERDLRAATEISPARAKARQILSSAHTRSGGFKTMRSRIAALCASDGPCP